MIWLRAAPSQSRNVVASITRDMKTSLLVLGSGVRAGSQVARFNVRGDHDVAQVAHDSRDDRVRKREQPWGRCEDPERLDVRKLLGKCLLDRLSRPATGHVQQPGKPAAGLLLHPVEQACEGDGVWDRRDGDRSTDGRTHGDAAALERAEVGDIELKLE